jgi:hypothetical protein
MAKKQTTTKTEAPRASISPEKLQELRDSWLAQWPTALTIWSKFTRLSEPRWCFTHEDAAREGLTSSFAMIRFDDQAVVIDFAGVVEHHVEKFAREILAHEIGHHVYCPADLADHARMIARMRWGLPTKEQLASFIGNLYTDLLINDRLQRSAELDIAGVYRALGGKTQDRLWTFYMRIYEILWSLSKGTLATGEIDEQLAGDAHLGARLIRSYAHDWLHGAGRFAALCLPYLTDDNGAAMQKLLKGWRDMDAPSNGTIPNGLTDFDGNEQAEALHPALDPELTGIGAEEDGEEDVKAPPSMAQSQTGNQRGQRREPFQYGEILKSLGLKLTDHELAVRYYKEQATPHLIRFPARILPEATEPLAEGLTEWDIGSALDELDMMQTVLVSPRIIPNLTTVQRVWGTTEGSLPEKQPLDLDLYVDCSGSMPNPQVSVSYLTLAGAIICLSALRAGARVQATLWSGARQFETTNGFVRDGQRILQVLTGYFGGGTAFPIHILRDTYQDRKKNARAVHIMVISDDGVTTMFDQDEKNNAGWDIAHMALAKARGGITLVLNSYDQWLKQDAHMQRVLSESWNVSLVSSWGQLVTFAKQFSRTTYSDRDMITRK